MTGWLDNPYGVHGYHSQASMSVSELGAALLGLDRRRIGSGLNAYSLRVTVSDSRVSIDPQEADVAIGTGRARIFRGTLRPGDDSAGCVLEGVFELFWMPRFIFIPVFSVSGVAVCVAATVNQMPLLGLLGIGLLYWPATYVIPRLALTDARRSERVIRELLDDVMQQAPDDA